MIEKIISGGQTGADRGGLDGAWLHWEGNKDRIGGWCPASRRAEDGPIPAHYPLQETEEWDYPPRIALNVKWADGTVVFTHGEPTGGSKLTLDLCDQFAKQWLHIDVSIFDTIEAAEQIAEWVEGCEIKILNVAGSRESTCPGMQDYVTSVIERLLEEVSA